MRLSESSLKRHLLDLSERVAKTFVRCRHRRMDGLGS
jgi:hypothetical protein